MEGNIKRRLSFLLNFIVVNPLSLRNPTETETSDGSTSSTVVFASVSAIFFITIAYSCVTAQQNMDLTNYSLWILVVVLMVLMVAGTVAIGLILFLIICRHSVKISRRQSLEDRSSKLEIKFLWFSGFGLLLRTGLNLAISIECAKYLTRILGISRISSSILKILYLLFQMSILTYLRNVQLGANVLINYLIGVILLANVSLWMSNVMLNFTFKNGNFNSSMSLINASAGETCFWHSKCRKISTYLRPFLLTASMIFLMLSSKFLIRLWHSIQTISYVSNFYDKKEEEGECSDRCQPEDRERPNVCKIKTTKIIAFFIGILLNTPFFTMAILMRFIYFSDVTSVKVFWDVFACVFLVIAIIVVLVGTHNLRLDHLEKRAFEMWDFVLLICMAGNVIMNTLGCSSVIVCNVDRPITIFIKNILSLLLTYYHTMYITVARRIPPRVLCQSSTIRFLHVLMFCCFHGRWLLQTFFLSSEGMYILREGRACLFPSRDSWLTLQYFLIPVNTFYDFQSFVFYYGKL